MGCVGILFFVFLVNLRFTTEQAINPGRWQLLIQNGGVSAMHMTLTPANTVIIYDRTDYGRSQLALPRGKCRIDPNDLALKVDCYAHSIELDLPTNAIRPLQVQTDTWCSSGAFQSDGRLVSTGGFNDGAQSVRFFTPCADEHCDWDESSAPNLLARRWYASNQILPDNRIIVVGGRGSFSYEFVPAGRAAIQFPFLTETNVAGAENNLYPFLHLSSDGNLFVFANKQSILLDYKTNTVVRKFPDLPGGGRNYPSSGSSVMLPLSSSDNFHKVEVMICGGAPDGSYQQANKKLGFVTALNSCGRMVITDANPGWAMEEMPSARVMGDMLILPEGGILIINGAQQGAAGWGNARQPSLSPLLYRSDDAAGKRFHELAATDIPRLYHSTANVLPDGRILVGGSNPNSGYTFQGVPYPTELRLETYSPYYLSPTFKLQRPGIIFLSKNRVAYASTFTVHFSLFTYPTNLHVRIYAPPFTTHAYSMNQRQLILSSSPVLRLKDDDYVVTVTAPPTSVAAPSGYYLLFVVNAGIPSAAKWVRFS